MTKELGLFFVGVALGSLNPEHSLWGWLIPLIAATFFIGIDLIGERKRKLK